MIGRFAVPLIAQLVAVYIAPATEAQTGQSSAPSTVQLKGPVNDFKPWIETPPPQPTPAGRAQAPQFPLPPAVPADSSAAPPIVGPARRGTAYDVKRLP